MRKTNEEFISELMCYSRFGALTQVFVIEAISYYAESIAKLPAPVSKPSDLIDPLVWHMIASDVRAQLVANYE